MWWKMPVLLALGSPLLWWAWKELDSHPHIVRPRDAIPSSDSLARRRGEQQAFLKELDGVVLDEDLASTVLCVSLDREPSTGSRSEANKKLAEALKKHHAAIEQVRLFRDDIVAVEEKRGAGPTCKPPEYVAWLEKRRKDVADIHARLAKPLEAFGMAVAGVNEKLKARLPGKFLE